MFYDALLIVAIWMLSTLAWVALLNDGEAVGGPVFQGFLYMEAAIFHICFWRIRGQTLGMQVWKIQAVRESGELMSIGEGIARFFFATCSMALMGLGYLWMLFDRDRLTWHDRASGTCVLFLGKNAYGKQVSAMAETVDEVQEPARMIETDNNKHIDPVDPP